MKQSTTKCKKCGAEILDNKMRCCPECGTKISRPIYKKWWFWVIIGIVVVFAAIGGSGSDSETPTTDTQETEISTNSPNSVSNNSAKEYETVDLQKMIDDLNENALRAEKEYQNKYIAVEGKIANFDSDGTYISIEPVNASEWNFDTVMCYIKSSDQRELLLTKSKGDIVKIKGKVISIGEVLGYSININEIE